MSSKKSVAEKTPDRNSIKALITEALRYSSKDEQKITEIATAIEKSCYNYSIRTAKSLFIERDWGCIQFVIIYSDNVYKILNAIRPCETYSEKFVSAILSGGINLENIAYMNPDQMDADADADVRSELEIRKKQKIAKKIATGYRCRKCGGNQIVFGESQRRASDEAASIKFSCLDCANEWIG